jgi:hypothetical protein
VTNPATTATTKPAAIQVKELPPSRARRRVGALSSWLGRCAASAAGSAASASARQASLLAEGLEGLAPDLAAFQELPRDARVLARAARTRIAIGVAHQIILEPSPEVRLEGGRILPGFLVPGP